MIQYNMTWTPLSRAENLERVPTENELLAIHVALMLHNNCSGTDLAERNLVLTENNRARVASIIRQRLSPLARDFGDAEHLDRRLGQLIGLSIAWCPS